MGIDATGIVKGIVPFADILNFVKSEFDPSASASFKKYEYKKGVFCGTGEVNFIFNKEERRLRYYYNESVDKEEFQSYGIDTEKATIFTLGAWGNSSKILTRILMHCGGGYLCESDEYGPEYKQLQP